MNEDYRRKYEDLLRQFKKQQHTISKLQRQISERTRNYINHQGSKYLNGEDKQQYSSHNKIDSPLRTVQPKGTSEQSLNISKEESQFESINASRIDYDSTTEQELRDRKKAKLQLSNLAQMEFNQLYHTQTEKKQADNRQIIDGLKIRIANIQKTKNDVVKQLQKSQQQNKQLKAKIAHQQRQLQKVVKSQNKLKQKLKKMPYQQSIEQIYDKFRKVLRKDSQEQEDNTDLKIEAVLRWIQQIGHDQEAKPLYMNKNAQQSNQIQINQSSKGKEDTSKQPFENAMASYEMSGDKKAWSTVQIPMWTIQSDIKAAEDYKISDFSARKAEDDSIIRSLQQHSACLEQEVAQLKYQNSRIKQELAQSRKKSQIHKEVQELNQDNRNKEVDSSKPVLQASKATNISQVPNTSTMTVEQQLEPPYYVQEEMQIDANHQYVKRSFVRKKIVRRNLSATAYRVVSKSKEEIKHILQSKISHYSQKSKEKAKQVASQLTREAKMQALKSSLKEMRVSQVSHQSDSRQSDREDAEQIKIVQLETTTPYEQITSTKIYTSDNEETLCFRKKL